MSEYLHFIPLALSFAAVVGLVPLTIHLAIKCGFLDQPNARKVHQHAIPASVDWPSMVASPWELSLLFTCSVRAAQN